MIGETATVPHTLVLGVGNILLEDEGVGVRVVEELRANYRIPAGVEVLDGGTSGMDLLGTLCDREHVVIVDAVRIDEPPGTIVRLVDDEVKRFFRAKISPHQLGISDLLAATTLMGRAPRALTLLGIAPLRMEGGVELSPLIAERVRDLVALVIDQAAALGHELRRLDPHPGALAACA